MISSPSLSLISFILFTKDTELAGSTNGSHSPWMQYWYFRAVVRYSKVSLFPAFFCHSEAVDHPGDKIIFAFGEIYGTAHADHAFDNFFIKSHIIQKVTVGKICDQVCACRMTGKDDFFMERSLFIQFLHPCLQSIGCVLGLRRENMPGDFAITCKYRGIPEVGKIISYKPEQIREPLSPASAMAEKYNGIFSFRFGPDDHSVLVPVGPVMIRIDLYRRLH